MRGKTLIVAVWVLGVVAASFATWRAIDAAGRQILSEPYQPVLSSEQPGETAETSSTATAQPSSSGKSGKGKHGGGGQQSSSAAPPVTSTPTQAPSVTRSWRDTPGSVVATCSGGVVTLNSITPNNGYQFEPSDDKTSQAKVHFEPKSDRGSEVTVEVTCSAGVPKFATGGGD